VLQTLNHAQSISQQLTHYTTLIRDLACCIWTTAHNAVRWQSIATRRDHVTLTGHTVVSRDWQFSQRAGVDRVTCNDMTTHTLHYHSNIQHTVVSWQDSIVELEIAWAVVDLHPVIYHLLLAPFLDEQLQDFWTYCHIARLVSNHVIQKTDLVYNSHWLTSACCIKHVYNQDIMGLVHKSSCYLHWECHCSFCYWPYQSCLVNRPTITSRRIAILVGHQPSAMVWTYRALSGRRPASVADEGLSAAVVSGGGGMETGSGDGGGNIIIAAAAAAAAVVYGLLCWWLWWWSR